MAGAVDADDDSWHLALLLMLTHYYTIDARHPGRRRSGAHVPPCGAFRLAVTGTKEVRPAIRDFVPSASRSASCILLPMDANGSVLEHLSRDECLRLMGSVPVGRIVYTRQAL